MGYDVLFVAFDLVEQIGAPIAIAAWLTVSLGSLAMAWVLKRYHLRPHLLPAAILGTVTMLAHFSDIFMTLKISPDLALEGNPIWLIVVDRWGLEFALVYGYTGKFLVGVLNIEFFLLYRATRAQVFPAEATSFPEFLRRLGESAPRKYGIAWLRIVSLFSYLFGYLGVWSFWVAFQNWAGGTRPDLYEKLPSPPIVIALALLSLALCYLVETYFAFRRSRRAAVATATN